MDKELVFPKDVDAVSNFTYLRIPSTGAELKGCD